jgi:ribosomal protein S18 acetylase RimI-like enzyme
MTGTNSPGRDAPAELDVRRATVADAPALAALHATRISEGFLPSLGPKFLTRLYARIARSSGAFGYVVADGDHVLAFATGAESVSKLYKEFVIHDGVAASFDALPRLARSVRRVVETLRYPATTTDLPRAEILSVATDAAATGRGHGALALRAATTEFARRGCSAVKVTVGAANTGAVRFYESCAFERRGEVTVHGDARSEVLVWTA